MIISLESSIELLDDVIAVALGDCTNSSCRNKHCFKTSYLKHLFDVYQLLEIEWDKAPG